MWPNPRGGWTKGKRRAVFDPDSRVRKLQKGIGLASVLARPGKLRIIGEKEWRKVGSLVLGLGPDFGAAGENSKAGAARTRKARARTKPREP